MPVFDGVFNDRTHGVRSFDDMFKINVSGMPVRATSPDIILKVKPAPKGDNVEHWLPANNIQLEQKWDAKGTLKAGEPIVRTITIHATGLTAEQLPNITEYELDNVNHYNDAPKFENIADNNSIIGTRSDSITFIPTVDGEIEFPEIKLKWWDVKQKKFKIAKIAGKKLTVLPVKKEPAKQIEIVNPSTQMSKDENVLMANKQAAETNPWVYVAAGILLLWLLTIVGWLYSRRSGLRKTKQKSINASQKQDTLSIKELFKLIETNCRSGNAVNARKYILMWLEKKLKLKPNQLTIQQLISKVNYDTKQDLLMLEKTVYGDSSKPWYGTL